MAELNIQKKNSPKTLWIVLGVLLIALVVWYVTRPRISDRDVQAPGAMRELRGMRPAASLGVGDGTVVSFGAS